MLLFPVIDTTRNRAAQECAALMFDWLNFNVMSARSWSNYFSDISAAWRKKEWRMRGSLRTMVTQPIGTEFNRQLVISWTIVWDMCWMPKGICGLKYNTELIHKTYKAVTIHFGFQFLSILWVFVVHASWIIHKLPRKNRESYHIFL